MKRSTTSKFTTANSHLASPLKKVEELIEFVLSEYPETRSSDAALYFEALEIQGIVFDPKTVQRAIRVGINFETCRRTRQHLQNNLGKYLPNKEVREARLFAEGKWREKWRT